MSSSSENTTSDEKSSASESDSSISSIEKRRTNLRKKTKLSKDDLAKAANDSQFALESDDEDHRKSKRKRRKRKAPNPATLATRKLGKFLDDYSEDNNESHPDIEVSDAEINEYDDAEYSDQSGTENENAVEDTQHENEDIVEVNSTYGKAIV